MILKMNFNSIQITKINLNLILYLKVKSKTIKLLEQTLEVIFMIWKWANMCWNINNIQLKSVKLYFVKKLSAYQQTLLTNKNLSHRLGKKIFSNNKFGGLSPISKEIMKSMKIFSQREIWKIILVSCIGGLEFEMSG